MNALLSKIHGCEAAGTIGNSMGDPVEGLFWRQIEERFGFVDSLLAQDKKDARSPQPFGDDFVYHAHHRPPGTTEDGHERHRLCTNAILRKGGRITIEDLATTWISDVDPEKFGYLMGPQDRIIYAQLKAGVPPWEVGRNVSWPGFIGTSKMIMPVGMVNACNSDQAAADAHDLGRIKDVRGVKGNYALEVCAGIAAATAAALQPDATVESIIETALGQLSSVPRGEIEETLTWTDEVDDWKGLRPLFHDRYLGCAMSNAVEILGGALCCLRMSGGQPREAILYAVNLGRDTDCKAYISGGLAGALMGSEHVPNEWVETVDSATQNDPWTVSNRTTRETAQGLYKAAITTMNQMKSVVETIEGMI
jgi:ADP-ribosylglycohydrolase